MTFGRLIEQTQLRLSIAGRRVLTLRNDANHFARWQPADFIAWMDVVLLGNHPGHGDLILGRDLRHVSLL